MSYVSMGMMDGDKQTNDTKVAVVGAGRMGRHHARNYRQIPHCRLIAVVDGDPARAQAAAQEFGCRAYGTAAELLASAERPDAVSIAVPTIYHRSVAEEFLAGGVHILVEKPLASTPQDACAIVELARHRGCVLQVGHSERFNPVVRALNSYQLHPQFLEVHRISPMTFRSIDVGVVLDMMIHDIDIVHHFVRSPVQSVAAVGVSVIGRCEDVANARLVFANGCVANLTASRLAMKTERRMRLFSPDAYVSVDYQKKSGVVIQRRANATELGKIREKVLAGQIADLSDLNYPDLVNYDQLAVDDREPLRVELESFLHAIRNASTPEVTGEDGCVAVEVATRIMESIADHQRHLRPGSTFP